MPRKRLKSGHYRPPRNSPRLQSVLMMVTRSNRRMLRISWSSQSRRQSDDDGSDLHKFDVKNSQLEILMSSPASEQLQIRSQTTWQISDDWQLILDTWGSSRLASGTVPGGLSSSITMQPKPCHAQRICTGCPLKIRVLICIFDSLRVNRLWATNARSLGRSSNGAW